MNMTVSGAGGGDDETARVIIHTHMTAPVAIERIPATWPRDRSFPLTGGS
jgi:hypothetical protein